MALTISSFLSVSGRAAAVVSVCINRNSRLCEALSGAGSFGVRLLAHDQAHGDTFAGRPRPASPRLRLRRMIDQATGHEPEMCGVSLSAECALVSATDAGTHRLFIGEVKRLS